MNSKIGVTQGVGLVVASTIGSGLFVSTGFMLSQGLTPSEILLEWFIGGLWAFCGAVLYGHIAQSTPLNGGEPVYIRRYLSDRLGYLITLLTIVIGFICPIVFDAIVTGNYVGALIGWEQPQIIASLIILFFIGTNYITDQNQFSDFIQQLLVLIKLCSVVAIIAIGFWWLDFTSTYTPYSFSFSPKRIDSLLGQQYWVVYAFSGFNAAIYIAERFKKPEQQVKKSIYYGLFLVFCCYILINHIFVQVLMTTDIPQAVLDDGFNQITLCHLLFQKMFQSNYGNIISLLMIFIFLSSISVMFQLVIPICTSLFSSKIKDHMDNKNIPLTKLCLLAVGCLALILVWFTSIVKVLASISFIIYFVSSLTISIILLNRLPQGSSYRIRILSLGYILSSLLLLAYGIVSSDMVYSCSIVLILMMAWLFRKSDKVPTSIPEQSDSPHRKYNT